MLLLLIALTALPAAVALFAAHHAIRATEATCRTLRTTILATLEANLDASAERMRAAAYRDLTNFQRNCALTDPDAKAVFAAFDRAILFAPVPDSFRSRPVRLTLPPPPPPLLDWQDGLGEGPGPLLKRMREQPLGT